MFRTASRALLRAQTAAATKTVAPTAIPAFSIPRMRCISLAQARRFAGTDANPNANSGAESSTAGAAAAKPQQQQQQTKRKTRQGGGWRSAVVRFGLAGYLVYWYNTSAVFAEEPSFSFQGTLSSHGETAPTTGSTAANAETIESVTAAKRTKSAAKLEPKPELKPESAPPATAEGAGKSEQPVGEAGPSNEPTEASVELESEAGQEGAFNPETGEINWDCPCLGGMAHGPCGTQFREAFSCFVYSTEEPKGMDCIDKFKAMQDCFRLYPDVYGGELEDEELENKVEVDQKAIGQGEGGEKAGAEA